MEGKKEPSVDVTQTLKVASLLSTNIFLKKPQEKGCSDQVRIILLNYA